MAWNQTYCSGGLVVYPQTRCDTGERQDWETWNTALILRVGHNLGKLCNHMGFQAVHKSQLEAVHTERVHFMMDTPVDGILHKVSCQHFLWPSLAGHFLIRFC